MKNKKLEELIYRYEEAIADNKIPYLDASEYSEIASYYWVEKRDEDAKKAIENGLRIHPDNDDIMRIRIEFLIDDGELTEARSIMDNLHSHPSMGIQYLNAELYYEEGDREKSLSILNKLFEINTDEDVFISMAELYSDLDEQERALECLEIADRITPGNQDVSQQMVTILTALGNYTEAAQICNKIIDEDPYSFFAWFRLAECYSALAEYDKAIESAEFAMIANPESEGPYFIRGQSFLALENYEKALQDMVHILDSDILPMQYLYYYIGICQMNLDNYKDALESLELAEAESSKADDTLYYHILTNISKCFFELGQYEEARLYEKMLPFNIPGDVDKLSELERTVTLEQTAENWYNLGISYLENKLFEKAILALERAKIINPTLKGLGLNLLLAYVGSGDKKKIKENLHSISNNLKRVDPAFKMDASEDQIDRIIEKIHEIFSAFFDATESDEGNENNESDDK